MIGSPRLTLVVLAAGLLSGGFGFSGGGAFDGLMSPVSSRFYPADPAALPRYPQMLSLPVLINAAAEEAGPEVVMIGDSLTAGGSWSELLHRPVAGRGLGGDTSIRMLQRLKVSVPKSAKTVVIMIGLNDLKDPAFTPEASAANVKAMLDQLQGRRVILQSVLYTANDQDNLQIIRLNAAYRKLCANSACIWLDLNPAVVPTGKLAPEDTIDGRHLKGGAYLRWAAKLEPLL